MFEFNKPEIAIDIGHYSIKIAKYETPRENQVDRFSVFKNDTEIELHSSKESRMPETKSLSAAIKTAIKENKLAFGDAFVVIPDNLTVTKVMLVGVDDDTEKIEKEIADKLSTSLPLPLVKWNWDYQIVGQAEMKNLAIVEAILKSNALEIEKIVRKAGINPVLMDASSFNIMNYFYGYLSSPDNHDKNICIVNLGHNSTTTSIYKNSVLKAIQTKSVGGLHFTRQLSDALGVSRKEAENIKHTHTIFLPEFISEQDDIEKYKIIKPVFRELVQAVFGLFEYYLEKFRETRVDEVLITGGGANFKNIDVQLQGHLNTRVIQGYKVNQLSKKDKLNPIVSTENQNLLSAVCGSLLRE